MSYLRNCHRSLAVEFNRTIKWTATAVRSPVVDEWNLLKGKQQNELAPRSAVP